MMKIRSLRDVPIERALCRQHENPVAIVLFLVLNNLHRRMLIEDTRSPLETIEKVKRHITVTPINQAYEYGFADDGLGCDIRVIASHRMCEDFSINNYRKEPV